MTAHVHETGSEKANNGDLENKMVAKMAAVT